jgi:hypothetical protein
LSSRVEDAPQKPNHPSPVQDLERAGFQRPSLPPTVYAVDGMGSLETATVERTTGQRRRGLCSISQRGAIPPIYRHRHRGGCKGNARNEGLETPVLKSTQYRRFNSYSFSLAFQLQTRLGEIPATRGARASRRVCVGGGARVWSSSSFSHFHILVVGELTLYVGAHLSQLAMWD